MAGLGAAVGEFGERGQQVAIRIVLITPTASERFTASSQGYWPGSPPVELRRNGVRCLGLVDDEQADRQRQDPEATGGHCAAIAGARIRSVFDRRGYRASMTNSLKSTVVRKAAKVGAKHTAHGTAAKLKRQPMRAGTLLAVGGGLGVLTGWAAARRGATH